MPPPPPPAPPPPPSLVSVTKAPAVRTKLLSEIHQGAKLKKTVTNDRSAPLIISGKVNTSSASDPNGASSQSGGGGVQGKVAVPSGIGALFAGGVPRKPSDVKNLKQVNQTTTSCNSLSNVSSAPAPPAKITASMAPKPTAPFGQSKSTLLPSTKPTIPSTAKNVAVKNGIVSQLQSNLQNNLRIEPPHDLNKFSATNSISQPPVPPSAKLKPALPTVPSSVNKPCLPSTGGRPIVKQESVTQMRRPAAPPPPPPDVHLNAHNHLPSTPHRDRGPLPPPPSSTGCSSSNTMSSSMSPINMPSHDLTSLRSLNMSSGSSGAPSVPPPPPPRISSCMDSIEQRFHFVPISELPPPPRFVGFRKIYEVGQHRKSTGAAH